jgi:CRISPR-associated endonuclease/helicase Cas3
VPFTAIIEQTADEFRRYLDDDDAVLEHHSGFDAEIASEDETRAEQMKLAAQNWDRPVVVSTAVQFFESLFANRTQKCRKLHNIARSVIVLDEAQTLPVTYLRPCLAALKELVRGYGCSVVLCTATPPAVRDEDGLRCAEAIPAEATREIAPNPPELYRRLKRVEAQFVGAVNNADLAARVAGQKALVIVNNKRHARALYDLLGRLRRAGDFNRTRGGGGRSRFPAGLARGGGDRFRRAGGGALQPQRHDGGAGRGAHFRARAWLFSAARVATERRYRPRHPENPCA